MASIIGIIPRHSKNNIYSHIRIPPVGIISVLSQLDCDRYAVDENNYSGPLDFSGMPDHSFLQKKHPSDIAMFYGGMTNAIPRVYSTASIYRSMGVITVAGGSHVDAMPVEALTNGIDIVVHGEGEITAKELVPLLTPGWRERVGQVKGISYLDDKGTYVRTERREPIGNIEELVDPDLTIIKHLKKRWSAIPINKGRGCRWDCEFCVVNKQYGDYKASSGDKVFRQIVRYSDIGYGEFFFTDDNFAQSPNEAITLCRMIGDYKREFKKKIGITVQVRSEVAANDKLLDAMRYAGVKTLCIGYESPIDEELALMNKHVTASQLLERTHKLRQHFYIHGMFIFGYPFPEHNINLPLEERAKRYIRFFRKSQIDTIQVLSPIPLPGTRLRERLVSEGRVLPGIGWEKYDGLHLCIKPDGDLYEFQSMTSLLMRMRYDTGILNYGNWMNWTYNSVGFPFIFGYYYSKRFLRNLLQKRRESSMDKDPGILKKSLQEAWDTFKRKWRNLAIHTYANGIVRRFMKEEKRQ